MKTLLLAGIVLTLTVSIAAAAERSKPARVPPPGIAIKESDRTELQSGADSLAGAISELRSDLAGKPALLELLPDVQVFHKAVDWALRYDEFYRSNEVALARGLLKQGTERARQLREDKPSWLAATGLVVRGYVSKIDGSVQPYGLVVPASFSAERIKARRLDVWLHGRDNNLTELKFIADRQRSYGDFTPTDTIVLHPYGRYCNAFKFAGEVDVFEAMEHVKKSYRIDERRIALRGFSMGGAGVWHLAAHHPGVWAVAAPGAGFAETAEYTKALAKESKPSAWEQKLWQMYDATDYAANFFNLPIVAYNGTDDPQRQAAEMMERAMKAEGLELPRVWGTNIGHKYTPEAKREVSAFVDDAVAHGKETMPSNLIFTTRSLRYSRAAGLEVRAMDEHWAVARVEIDRAARNIAVKNVSSFLLQVGSESKWRINGQEVIWPPPKEPNAAHEVNFIRRDKGGWGAYDAREWFAVPLPPTKTPGRQGPIDDAFMDSFLIVRPTGVAQNATTASWISAQLAKATNDWRAHFRGNARLKDDAQVNNTDIAAHNLVLFGDPQSNRLLARIVDKLPIQWNAQSVKVGGRTFSAATHAPVFIFPNPLNPRRYVVLNSGFTFAAAGAGSNAQQTPKFPDYAVLKMDDNSVALAGFFDEQWRVK